MAQGHDSPPAPLGLRVDRADSRDVRAQVARDLRGADPRPAGTAGCAHATPGDYLSDAGAMWARGRLGNAGAARRNGGADTRKPPRGRARVGAHGDARTAGGGVRGSRRLAWGLKKVIPPGLYEPGLDERPIRRFRHRNGARQRLRRAARLSATIPPPRAPIRPRGLAESRRRPAVGKPAVVASHRPSATM